MKLLKKYCLPLLFIICISCGDKPEKESGITTEEKISDRKRSGDTTGTKFILFFGNSLTAGMGLEPSESFPSIIQEKIDSLGLEYEVVNAGLSGETTASGKNRIGWVLNQQVEVFVLELGANDGLRGLPLDETRRNLQAIIDTVRNTNLETEIILAGMQIPPNMGHEYTFGFRRIYPELAQKNDIHLIPFLLEGVAGEPDLNQEDGIHPTAEGQKIVARNVWSVLEEVIRNRGN